MKITSWKKGKKHDSSGTFIQVSTEEAIRIIMSLSNQIYNKSSNDGREEMYTEEGEYFTIAVTQKQVDPSELELDHIYSKIEHNAQLL